MPGRSKAPKSGSLLKDKVVKLAQQLGLRVETEVKAARRIWGQRRYIDVVLIDDRTGKRLGIECKFQATLGAAEEKMPATIQDIAHWPIPGLVVIDGEGFSENMKWYFLSTGKVVLFSELEEWLILDFEMGSPSIPKPFLKWAGGKTQLADALLARMPPAFGTYHEPFLGSGALFFRLYREGKLRRAILSDINPELIDTYLAIRDQPAAVIQLLAEFPYDKTFYYQLRARNPWEMSLAERAARMIYLNKTGYNGLYRVNRQGRFNVPFGRYKSPRYFDPENLLAVSRALQQAEIICAPFESVLTRAQAGDWVYFDPPYMPISETAHFTAYHADGFGLADQARLRDVCLRLTEMGVGVMVSNSDVPDIRDLYSWPCFRIDTVFANRAINSNGARRGKIAELVIVNYDCAGRSFDLRPRHMPDQQKAKTWANKPAQQTGEALPHEAQSQAGIA